MVLTDTPEPQHLWDSKSWLMDHHIPPKTVQEIWKRSGKLGEIWGGSGGDLGEFWEEVWGR